MNLKNENSTHVKGYIKQNYVYLKTQWSRSQYGHPIPSILSMSLYSGMWFCWHEYGILGTDSTDWHRRTARPRRGMDTVDGTQWGHREWTQKDKRSGRSGDTMNRRSEDSKAWTPGGNVVSPSNSVSKSAARITLAITLRAARTADEGGGSCAPRKWLVLPRREREEREKQRNKTLRSAISHGRSNEPEKNGCHSVNGRVYQWLPVR